MTQEEIKLQVIKERANDLILFARTITPVRFKLPTPKFHYEVSEMLMDRTKEQTAIQAPRGFAKSTLAVAMCLHHAIYDKGDKVIVIQSKTRPEAMNRLADIKNIISYSTSYVNIYGYAGQEIATTWREDKVKTIINGNTVVFKAIGTGQPARGMLESGVTEKEGVVDVDITRITLYYLDDADDEDNTVTKEQMAKNWDKFQGSKEGLAVGGRVIVVGTPIRQGCIIDRIFNDAISWNTRKYQAIWKENGETKLLWEERRDLEWLDNKKREFERDGTISKWYAEYMCEIVGTEDQLFKPEYLQYYEGSLEFERDDAYLRLTEINGNKTDIVKPVNIFLGIDPASSTKQTADYSVTFPIAYDSNKNIYVLPYYRRRVTPTAHAEQIIETIRTLKPIRGCVETVGYQEMLRQYLRNRLLEEGLNLPGLEIKFNPRTEKSARLEVLHPLFQNKKIYVSKNMQEFVDELSMYPRGKNDDLLDGLYYATRYLIVPDHLKEDKEYTDEEKMFIEGYRETKQESWRTA